MIRRKAQSVRMTPIGDIGKRPPPDPALKVYFQLGERDGFAGRKHRPPSACKGPEYAFGYLSGYGWKTFRRKIDWAAIIDYNFGKGYDDAEKSKLPSWRSKRLATRIRDITILIDMLMILYAMKRPNVDEAVSVAAEQFGLSERQIWNIWGNTVLPDNPLRYIKKG